ncbi:hypothetical protein OG775_03610 [Streptomyces platensis]|uniref:hypothetical protein n=1 Tax=Streptomyces platensis TaxID=58346 RepID=UPI002253B4ED|nr:hypothetical protein [Streptomyces platensis]MCX4634257.1 hypothetical protein [Streptomyces platensis]
MTRPQDSPAPSTTPDEALAIVRSRYAEPRLADGSPAPMQVEEFDLGYLVYAEYPDTTDATGEPQPAPPGGSMIIVAKDTGESVTVPNLPTETAIALYRQQRQQHVQEFDARYRSRRRPSS